MKIAGDLEWLIDTIEAMESGKTHEHGDDLDGDEEGEDWFGADEVLVNYMGRGGGVPNRLKDSRLRSQRI